MQPTTLKEFNREARQEREVLKVFFAPFARLAVPIICPALI